MKSKLLIHIVKEIETAESKIQIEEFITNLFVYTKQNCSTVLYLKNTNKIYTVNETLKKLAPITLEDRKLQTNQFKNLFSQINVSNKEEGQARKIFIEGNGNNIKLSGEVKISKFQALQNSANLASHKLLSETSLVDINIDNNEIPDYVNIDINIQGQKIKNRTKIKNIKVLTNDINRYDYVLNYSIN